MPRSASTTSASKKKPARKKLVEGGKKSVTKKAKKTVKAKKTTKAIKPRVRKQKIDEPVEINMQEFSSEIKVPEFTLVSPSLSHGHSVYQQNSSFKPSQRKKHSLIIGVGVSTIMTLIIIAWIINLKSVISSPQVDINLENQTPAQADLSDLKKELTDTLSEVKGHLNDLKSLEEETVTGTVAPDTEAEIRDAFKSSLEDEDNTDTPTSSVSPSVLP
jgi:hypothetical protein